MDAVNWCAQKTNFEKLDSFDKFDELENIELLRQDLTLETGWQEPDRSLSSWPSPGPCRRASPSTSPQTSKKILRKKEEVPQARRATKEEVVSEVSDNKKREDREKKMTGSQTSTPRLRKSVHHHHHCLDITTGGSYLPSSRPEEIPRMTPEGSSLRSSVTPSTLSRSLLGGTASTQGVGRGQELLETPGISPSCRKFKLANHSYLAVVPRLPHTAVCSSIVSWDKDDNRPATPCLPQPGEMLDYDLDHEVLCSIFLFK